MRDMLQTRSYDAFFMFPYFSPSAQAMIEQEKNATAFISMYMSSTRQKKKNLKKNIEAWVWSDRNESGGGMEEE